MRRSAIDLIILISVTACSLPFARRQPTEPRRVVRQVLKSAHAPVGHEFEMRNLTIVIDRVLFRIVAANL